MNGFEEHKQHVNSTSSTVPLDDDDLDALETRDGDQEKVLLMKPHSIITRSLYPMKKTVDFFGSPESTLFSSSLSSKKNGLEKEWVCWTGGRHAHPIRRCVIDSSQTLFPTLVSTLLLFPI